MAYHIDHLVMTVQDLERTCHFYTTVLGITVVTFGGGRKALQLANQKINLHPAQSPFPPHAQQPTVGAIDLCLLTDTPLEHIQRQLSDLGIPLVAGPVRRTGAKGPIVSLYLQDPDGNLIELSNPVRAEHRPAH